MYLTEISWEQPKCAPLAPRAFPQTRLCPVEPSRPLRLAIVLPCRDACTTIDDVLSALVTAQESYDVQLKLYATDDGSIDTTLDRLTLWSVFAPHPVSVFHNPEPQGLTRTVFSSYQYVMSDVNFIPDYIVRMDADMDDDPLEIIKCVVQAAALEPDAVAIERSRAWHDANPPELRDIMLHTRQYTSAIAGTIPFDPFVAATAVSRTILLDAMDMPIVLAYDKPWGLDALLLLRAWRDGAMVQRLVLRNSNHVPARNLQQLQDQAHAHAWILSHLWPDPLGLEGSF